MLAAVLQTAAASWVIGALVRGFRLWAPVAIPVLVVLVVLDSGFWNGYAGHPLGLTILGAYLVLPRRQQLTWWAVLAFSVFSFFTQGFYYVCFALVVGCLALARRRLVAPILGALPSVGLALWYAAANTVNPGSGQLKIEGLTQFIAYKGYTLAKLGGYQNLQINTVGDARPLVLVGVGVNLVMVGLLLLLALVATVRRVAGPDLVPLRCAGWAFTGLAAELPGFPLRGRQPRRAAPRSGPHAPGADLPHPFDLWRAHPTFPAGSSPGRPPRVCP